MCVLSDSVNLEQIATTQAERTSRQSDVKAKIVDFVMVFIFFYVNDISKTVEILEKFQNFHFFNLIYTLS
jgi:hypothetical protein